MGVIFITDDIEGWAVYPPAPKVIPSSVDFIELPALSGKG